MGINLYRNGWSFAEEGEIKLNFTGNLFFNGENIVDATSLLALTKNDINVLFNDVVPYSSGSFAVIAQTGGKTVLIADIVRSKPLFYYLRNSEYVVTDSLVNNVEGEDFIIDNERLEEYVVSGYVYGYNTIYKDVYGLQAGEIVSIENTNLSRSRYFRFIPKASAGFSVKDFASQLDTVFFRAFKKAASASAPGTNIIVPLSGGHDSRIIVNYLYKLGIRNVVCYTYGVTGNEQSRLSRQVAQALDYKWHFVEYNEEKWHELHKDGLINQYIDFAFNGVSTPHLQDFLAVYELKKNGILKEGDIIVPGHTLDFITGGHLFDIDLSVDNDEQALSTVLHKYAPIAVEKSGTAITQAIASVYQAGNTAAREFKEYFNWQERQAKFIVNSLRVYEFFGFDTQIPFWDAEVVNLWLSVPAEDRIQRKMFFDLEKQSILADQIKDIPFAGENKPKQKKKQLPGWRKFIPVFVIQALLRITRKKTKSNEGLTTIYTLEAGNVAQLLHPVADYPVHLQKYFKVFLKRFPYQMNYHFLTVLYTVRRTLNYNKKQKQY